MIDYAARSGSTAGASDGRVGRRAFVARCAAGLVALGVGGASGGCASLAARRIQPVDGRLEIPLESHPELLEPDGHLRFEPVGHFEAIHVLALDDRRFAALSVVCTHLGCDVDVERERLVCPCHGSTYDRSGAVLQGPAELPLRRYATRVTPDGLLIVNLREGT